MRVRFIGSGDAFGSGGRWQTCIHLAAEGQVLLVGCGATSLTALKAQGVDPGTVGAVAVTHLHGDHFGGLPFLILDGQFSGRADAYSSPLRCSSRPRHLGCLARLSAGHSTFIRRSSAVHF
jgi:ribonuclease BN (tRNA processing enzyme)